MENDIKFVDDFTFDVGDRVLTTGGLYNNHQGIVSESLLRNPNDIRDSRKMYVVDFTDHMGKRLFVYECEYLVPVYK